MSEFEKPLQEMRALGSERHLEPGAFLWREGDTGDEAVLLQEGTLEVIHESPDGDVIVHRTLEAGALVGDIAVLDGLARSATVRAATPCRVLCIPAADFREFLRRRPDVRDSLFWEQVERVRSLTRDVTRTRHQAITDPLTKLYNFGFFRERLMMELDRARHTHDVVSLALFDIDHFKHYNDTHGHQDGNQALELAAEIFRSAGRRGDIIARYGGEEFVALLYGASREESYRFAEGVRERIEKTDFPGGTEQPLGRFTVSGGVATFPEDATGDEGLIEAADMSLYAAKEAGRNRIVVAGARTRTMRKG